MSNITNFRQQPYNQIVIPPKKSRVIVLSSKPGFFGFIGNLLKKMTASITGATISHTSSQEYPKATSLKKNRVFFSENPPSSQPKSIDENPYTLPPLTVNHLESESEFKLPDISNINRPPNLDKLNNKTNDNLRLNLKNQLSQFLPFQAKERLQVTQIIEEALIEENKKLTEEADFQIDISGTEKQTVQVDIHITSRSFTRKLVYDFNFTDSLVKYARYRYIPLEHGPQIESDQATLNAIKKLQINFT